jgi:hypothetical protein
MGEEQLANTALGIFTIIYFVLIITFYILQSWGLYMISKKLKDPYPWMAWIPFLSLYTMVKA